MRPTGEDGGTRPRVCDNCIRQKVKCDLGKPRCCRCAERGVACTYSSVRRKPGPAPGSQRPRASRRDRATGAWVSASPAPGGTTISSPSRVSPVDAAPGDGLTSCSPSASAGPIGGPDSASAPARSFSEPLVVTSEEEESLLEWYFDNTHHAIPLFVASASQDGDRPCDAVAGCSRDLIETMLIISAKLSRQALAAMTREELSARIDRMLGASSLREDTAGDSPGLDQFRQSCIFSFYEFHECPGQQAWMRMNKLVRCAYWMGLDQIDKMHHASQKWRAMSERELEEWRLVWWCVYCLDSYANVTTGMPYGVDERLISTVLPRGKVTIGGRRLSLPYPPEGLLEMVRIILTESPPEVVPQEINIISITILRHVGRAIQLHAVASAEELVPYVQNAERRLCALRLALPVNFFNPKRNAFAAESGPAHHFRLVTIQHILMAQILICISYCRHLEEGDDWLRSWQQVLELCQDITAIAKQWNGSFCPRVDPALCIIVFVSLIFLDLQLKHAAGRGDAAALQVEIAHCQTILLLFLEKFAESWTLPRLLILSFKGFKEALPSLIGCHQVQAVLRRFESPLHPRWLTFLRSVEEITQSCN
ncbi:hypothetical protein GE09DRAFT_689788 [Coniochaeta sp. 2T2.1]|nr:hypothetical protein GE09DRAFT_689788 [Coniochaeta sp. 2T2.1]